MKKLFLGFCLTLFLTESVHAVTVEEAKVFCGVWFPALVRGSRDANVAAHDLVSGFYAKNAEMIDPNFSMPLVGSASLIGYYSLILEKYPNWSFDILDIYPTENGFILHYMGHVPGQVENFRGIDIITLDSSLLGGSPRQWKILKLIGIYDRTPFRRQEERP